MSGVCRCYDDDDFNLPLSCVEKCSVCGKYGPHSFSHEPYCDFCGQACTPYFDAIKRIVDKGGE